MFSLSPVKAILVLTLMLLLVSTIVFSVVGNLIVIYVMTQEKKLHKHSNFYIVSVAVADFLLGLIGIPPCIYMVSLLTGLLSANNLKCFNILQIMTGRLLSLSMFKLCHAVPALCFNFQPGGSVSRAILCSLSSAVSSQKFSCKNHENCNRAMLVFRCYWFFAGLRLECWKV